MTIEQIVEIPADRRIFFDVPKDIPSGKVRAALTIIPFAGEGRVGGLAGLKASAAHASHSTEEALREAEKKASDPDRKPISRYFGSHPGILGGDGVAYQRKIRDEWD
jgi:hypothetical protein